MPQPLPVLFRTLAIAILAAAGVSGQTVLHDPNKIADARKLFDTLSNDTSGCAVQPLKPHYVFSLRIQAGYVVHLPLSSPTAAAQKWVVLTSITPQEGNAGPVYLSDVVPSPNAGSGSADSGIEGSYWLGKGRYDVKFLMFDGAGDVCRREWQIDARLNSEVHGTRPILAPGAVEGVRGPVAVRAAGAQRVGHLTILLHAASVLQKQILLGNLDRLLLLDGLVALMAELPARSVRVVVFNLEQRRELLRKDGFSLEELPEVVTALNAVQPAPVNYADVQNASGTVDFIGNLVNQEMRAAEPSGAVVFLGPRSIYRSKPPANFRPLAGTTQRFFYLICEPTHLLLPRSSTLTGGSWGPEGMAMGFPPSSPLGGRAMQPDLPYDTVWTNYGPNHGPDSIQYAVDQLKGKTLQVDSPATFARAVAAIVHLSGNNP